MCDELPPSLPEVIEFIEDLAKIAEAPNMPRVTEVEITVYGLPLQGELTRPVLFQGLVQLGEDETFRYDTRVLDEPTMLTIELRGVCP